MKAEPGLLNKLTLTLSDMHEGDLAEVMAIERLQHAWPWSEGNLRDSLQNGHWCQCLREKGLKAGLKPLAGYLVAMPGVQEVHLLNITVAPAFTGQGLARQMLQALCGWAKNQAAEQIWLEVRSSNARARQVYERFGFETISRRKNYYPLDGARREDAIVMRLPL